MSNWTSKHITQAIIEECNNENVNISKDLVAFVVSLYLLNPEWKAKTDENYERIIGTITRKLLEKHTSIRTMEMQLLFTKNYFSKNEAIKKHRQKFEKKTHSLVTEVCESTRVNTDRDIQKLYQKILILITLMSGLGNPMNPAVLKEAAMALQSVYLPSEVTNFVNLPKKAKNKQLIELMNIVSGIRIFNKDCKRDSQGIEDLPTKLQEAFETLKMSIFEFLEDLMKTVNCLTTALENFIKSDDIDDKCEQEKNGIVCIIEAITACRQQEIYVRKILADTEMTENEYKCLMRCLHARLTNLHETVKFRTAIPIVQVYPQFIDLSNIWLRLQDEIVVLDSLNNFLNQLKNINIKDVKIDENILGKYLKNVEILSDADRLEKSMGEQITECGDCPIFYSNSINELEKIHLEFLGFCAWTFVVCQGALIPGNPNIGVVKWRTRYFAFSSDETARKFGQDPNKYFYDALNFIRQHPEYINLFHLREEIEAINKQEKSSDEYNLKLYQDHMVQTDDHVFHSYIDPNYHHSLWEYRRNALKLMRIAQCRTKSTQTNLSHFKKTINIQVSMPKDSSVQTRKESECNTMFREELL